MAEDPEGGAKGREGGRRYPRRGNRGKELSTKEHEGVRKGVGGKSRGVCHGSGMRKEYPPWERGRPARTFLEVAERQHDFAGSHHVGGNRNGQAEGEPRRRCRSIRVAEMSGAAPGFVRAGRPRSRGTTSRRCGGGRTPRYQATAAAFKLQRFGGRLCGH